jgi:Sec-independent protein translocase protein TatA
VLDLSPEKLLALLTIGLLVLGPQKLPATARGLAAALAKARRLSSTLTEPMNAALSEVREAVEVPVKEIARLPQDPRLN